GAPLHGRARLHRGPECGGGRRRDRARSHQRIGAARRDLHRPHRPRHADSCLSGPGPSTPGVPGDAALHHYRCRAFQRHAAHHVRGADSSRRAGPASPAASHPVVQPLQLLRERGDGGGVLPSRDRLAPRRGSRSGGRRDGGRLHLRRPQPGLSGRRPLAGARTLTRGLRVALAPAAGRGLDHRLDRRPDARPHATGGTLDGPGHRRPAAPGANRSFRARPSAPASRPASEGPSRLTGDMADLPRAARLYLSAVLATASFAALIGIIVAPARLALAPVALVLLGCATVAQQFKVRSPKHQSYYTTTIFFFAAALLAGLVFVGLNHVLTALVIMWARGVPISRAGTLDWDNLGTDLALMSVGALGSLLWLTNPWFVPLCLGPLFLIYRSLLVPTLK